MNAQARQYLLGAIFLGLGTYQLVTDDLLEFALYSLAGLSFIVNSLTMEPRLLNIKKPLVVISWILICATGIVFLYVLQFHYL